MTNTTYYSNNEEWLRILGKGMVTIPKPWREELEIKEGKVVRARKTGNKIIIEVEPKEIPSRIYSQEEINQFLKEDFLEFKKRPLKEIEKGMMATGKYSKKFVKSIINGLKRESLYENS